MKRQEYQEMDALNMHYSNSKQALKSPDTQVIFHKIESQMFSLVGVMKDVK